MKVVGMKKRYLPEKKKHKFKDKRSIRIEIEGDEVDQFEAIRKRNHWTHADIYRAGMNAGYDQDAEK